MNSLVEYVVKRIGQNKNFLACFTGGTGSGKSYSAIRFAELISKETKTPFSEKNIVFEPIEFMSLINSGELQKGSVIIMDEAGVMINARKWMSSINMMINYVTQTFRHRNYIVLFCVPDFSFIDKAIRKMFHSYIETMMIDQSKKICWCKPFLLQVNQRNGDTYYKFLRYQRKGEPLCTLERVGFSMASKKLLQVYEDKKCSFTDKLNKGLQATLEEEEQKINGKKDLTDLQAQAVYLRLQGLAHNEIAEVMGMARPTISMHLSASKKKGYSFPISPVKNAPSLNLDSLKEEINNMDVVRGSITSKQNNFDFDL